MIDPGPIWRVGVELARWGAGRRQRYRVEGRSMVPTLAPDELVLVDPDRMPSEGEVVVARIEPEGLTVIKRVGAIGVDGAHLLISDNPGEGTDSRQWGPVPEAAIVGTVTLNLSRPLVSLDPRRPGDGPSARWLRR